MKLYITLLLCLFAVNSIASQKAITDEGDVVILNDDKTWTYEDGKAAADIRLVLNQDTFKKHKESNFELKSNKTNSSFSINSKKWKFKKKENGHEVAEYTFKLKDGDLYGMAISEEVKINVEELAKLAFDYAKITAPDVRIVQKEYRVVNGNKLIYMEMVGTIKSIKFKFLGYYYSNSSGSTQYVAYTGANLVDKYKSDINIFLNGFSVNK